MAAWLGPQRTTPGHEQPGVRRLGQYAVDHPIHRLRQQAETHSAGAQLLANGGRIQAWLTRVTYRLETELSS
jgi:hypothetical protein